MEPEVKEWIKRMLWERLAPSSWGEVRLTKVASLFREHGSPEDLRQILDEFVNERWARKEEREEETFYIFPIFSGIFGRQQRQHEPKHTQT
jgi:hypothetical protein